MANVWLNGKFIGTVDDPIQFVEDVKENRRKGILPAMLNISYLPEKDEIIIETSKGRLVRPLIVVKNGKPLLTDLHIKKLQNGELKWDDLVNMGVIEYLDAGEEENAYIAMSEDELTTEHTHLEISPLVMLGITALCVPFGNYNQTARYSIGLKSLKQGMGIYMANFHLRNEPDVFILHNPEVPLVRTFGDEIIEIDKHPVGQNIVVAVLTYEGYNMEDAVIMNLSSIQRGLMRGTYFLPFVAEEIKYPGGQSDKFCIPDKSAVGYITEHAYRFLEEDGIVSPGVHVNEGDVIVGKVSPPRFLNVEEEYSFLNMSKRDTSISLEKGERGIVDTVYLTESEEGNRKVIVKVRENKIPEIGDKFSSRHGQKGVIGMLIPEYEMPFTSRGIVPDLLFTPFGIPSRMTVSHLLEMLSGKVGALKGEFIDGTIFENQTEEELRKQLLELGFRDDGLETFYDGITGRMLKARIYVGNIFYARLRQIVSNKIQARARGRMQLLTRQPTEGRRKGGGIKLGEMELDAMLAYGASMLVNERFSSDASEIYVCETCGSMAFFDEINKKYTCKVCGESLNISKIQVSYAFKLFLEELIALGIKPKINLRTKYNG
ncbi:MAG: DNA-directed RNA polymerase subunit B [Candidatus Woesearchaeota archaeon]